MSCSYCGGNCPHDHGFQCENSWYEHYMAVDARELAAEYALRAHGNSGEPSSAMEAAFEERESEIGKKLTKGEL